MNLLVVGNGFDINNNLQTKYTDFLDECKSNNLLFATFKKAMTYNFFDNEDWNGFEKLLCHLLETINYLFSHNRGLVQEITNIKANNGKCDFDFIIRINPNQLPSSILRYLEIDCFLSQYFYKTFYDGSIAHEGNFENIKNESFIIKKHFCYVSQINVTSEYVISEIIDELLNQLNNLEELLKEFIKKNTNSKIVNYSEYIRKTFGNNKKSFEKIISFNYSRTSQNFFKLNEQDVSYIHGSVNSNIVLGIENNMIENQLISENSIYIKFFKRFRRILKDCNKSYNDKIINKLNDNSKVVFFGHSLDLADRSIIAPLFEKMYKKYTLYVYGDIDNYKAKLVNLIGLDLYEKLYHDDKIKFVDIESGIEKMKK